MLLRIGEAQGIVRALYDYYASPPIVQSRFCHSANPPKMMGRFFSDSSFYSQQMLLHGSKAVRRILKPTYFSKLSIKPVFYSSMAPTGHRPPPAPQPSTNTSSNPKAPSDRDIWTLWHGQIHTTEASIRCLPRHIWLLRLP